MSDSNKKNLLVFSIGPVQSFIAAARKTRDLWFGSHLLSEVAKAAAKAVHDNGGTLIFPGIEKEREEKELAAGSTLSVANVVLAEVSGDPKIVAEKAKAAAKKRWKKFAEDAKQRVKEIGGNEKVLRDDLWGKQIDDFLEFQAAWCSLDDDYAKSRKRVMQLLAGRKACRDFLPSQGQKKVPKSSLDGARETVLQDWKSPKLESVFGRFVERLYLRENEQLDAIGVVKRFADDSDDRTTFPSLQEFAVSPVLRNPQSSKMTIDKAVEKSPYLAVLMADGDKMGKAISAQTLSDDHRKLSIALSKFAGNVAKTVKENYFGECVYAGGDDVLAFLPLDTALECARKLHDDFADELKEYKDNKVSLSVGIVVVHYHEMLEDILEFARSAEKLAKNPNTPNDKDTVPFGDRNGLAISCYSRGNEPISIREQWQDDNGSLDNRLKKWAQLFEEDAISMKFPYDLRELVRLYEGFDKKCGLPVDAIRKGALQMAKQKRIIPKQKDPSEKSYLEKKLEELNTLASLRRLAEELLIAQTIGTAKKLRKEKEDSRA